QPARGVGRARDGTGDAGGGLTAFADVVEASRAVTDTSSRSRKVAILAELLGRLEPDGVPSGVGYAAVYGTEAQPSGRSSLTVREVDEGISEIEVTTGSGSAGERRELLNTLLSQTTKPEGDFLRRLLTGELRQGALAGIMADAVAKAAGVPTDLARRALMLSGDLTRMAQIALTSGEAGLREVGFEIFRPILPMLASTSANVTEALEGVAQASVEYKLDGIRIQIHPHSDEVRIYTRNLNNITETLPR